MKKRPPTSTIQHQVLPPCESISRGTIKPARFATCPGPSPLGEHRAVTYILGQRPRKEPAVLPRLFIRGHGGSIKLDLGGVGMRFSQAAFAHRVADDSLLSLHVCRGDIAVIEPAVRRICDGNLVLLEVEGHSVIRRIQKRKRIRVLSPVDLGSDEVILLAGQAIQGVVIGFLRVFGALRPIKYEGTEANYSTGLEVAAPPKRGRLLVEPLDNPRSRVRLARSLTDVRKFFASNQNGKNRVLLSEIDRTIRYMTRPDKR